MSDDAHDDRPDVGSVAEEAAKLFGVLASWAQDDADASGDGAATAHAPGGPGGPECAWCPVCRGVRWVRGTPPEVRAHLASAAASLAQAATALLAAAEQAPGHASGHASGPASGPAPDDSGTRGRPVEHIDLDDEPDPPDPADPQESAP